MGVEKSIGDNNFSDGETANIVYECGSILISKSIVIGSYDLTPYRDCNLIMFRDFDEQQNYIEMNVNKFSHQDIQDIQDIIIDLFEQDLLGPSQVFKINEKLKQWI